MINEFYSALVLTTTFELEAVVATSPENLVPSDNLHGYLFILSESSGPSVKQALESLVQKFTNQHRVVATAAPRPEAHICLSFVLKREDLPEDKREGVPVEFCTCNGPALPDMIREQLTEGFDDSDRLAVELNWRKIVFEWEN